jgi:chemotaxis family two-component system sensor kinase Cph1
MEHSGIPASPPTHASSTLDLSSCDREPIHSPGAIQPHGVLFQLTGADLRITAVSANVAEHFGRDPAALLDAPLSDVLDGPSVHAVTEIASQVDGGVAKLVRVHLRDAPDTLWRGFVQAGSSGVLLEIKRLEPQFGLAVLDFLESYDSATRRLQVTTGVAAICTTLAEEVRRLTGYDRVKVYRFAADWTGEVIAESSNGKLACYLGLHFPASDIPAQARALYVANLERQIPDVAYTPVPLVGMDAAPVDLSRAMLRSVSPVHIEYLRNMGVGASMSISILRQGVLWGLVACHHHEARYVTPELRQAGVLLAQLASWQLGAAEETAAIQRSMGVKAIETTLLHETTSGGGYREVLLSQGDRMLDLLQASGFALRHGGSTTTIGRTPPDAELSGLLNWLAVQVATVFQTDHLAAHYPRAAEWADAAGGAIAVSLGGASGNLLVWFRPEIARSVTWGGNPTKVVAAGAGGERLHPRHSFAAWTEAVRGRCQPWQPHEIATANGLRDMLVDVILRRSSELEQMNAKLVRSNEELEAFAYVASHDLKEPLRQIETFGTLLERVFRSRGAPAADATRWFAGIQSSSRRLRNLINDLAEYSRIGRHANPFRPTPLDEVVNDVLSDLATLIEETQSTIEVEPLPVLICDHVQMRQVFQNILTNAIKYRRPQSPPVIRVSASVDFEGGRNALGNLPALVLAIADNGIGIDTRHRERIFEPFQRLHSSDEYEGSGIGLAICRKIIERHRGSITVAGLGQGCTFKIIVPMRPHTEVT